MSTDLAEPPIMARKRSEAGKKTPATMAKIHADVMEDARIVVAVSQEGLTDYLSRLLRPLVARDRRAIIKRKAEGSE